MTDARNAFRIVAEVGGGLIAVAANALAGAVFALGFTIVTTQGARVAYVISLAAGYGVMAWVALRGLQDIPRRSRFDAWLVAVPPTMLATMWLVIEHVPLNLLGSPGHGFGADGGESNALFFPWIHVALWLAVASASRRIWKETP